MTKYELIKMVNEQMREKEIGNDSKQRLNKCSAYMFDAWFTDQNTGAYYFVTMLKSYSTYVAMYVHGTKTLIVFDYYSHTTTQHCNKFSDFLNENKLYVNRVVYLWKRSDRIVMRDYIGNETTYTKEIENTDFGEVLEYEFGIVDGFTEDVSEYL